MTVALGVLVALSLLGAGCGAAATPEVVEKEVVVEKPVVQTVVVEKEKVVKETVVETVVVEKEKPVTVKETVVVEKEVVKEVEKKVVVTATPAPVEQVLIGGFDVGPGGDWMAKPYHAGAGNIWRSKIFSTLVLMSKDFTEHVPGLAVSWEPNDDYTLWTFKLRKGVKWHDGEDFTANDVKFTAELLAGPDAATRNQFVANPSNVVGWQEKMDGKADEIAGIQVVDDLTFTVELIRPDPRFYDNCRNSYILPEHAVDFTTADYTTTDWFETRPIGTGPFKFLNYEKDQYMELVPNEYYWNGKPKLDKLVNRYFVDETAAVLALTSGDIQFTYVSGDVANRLKDDPRFQLFEGPSYVSNFLIFNHRRPWWQDKRVRQAVLYAIDVPTIIKQVYLGAAVQIPSPDPYPAFWPENFNTYDYNPDKARELLAEAGWDSSRQMEIYTYYSSQLAKDALAAFQAYLAEVGINAAPVAMEPASWRQIINSGDWDIAYRGAGAGPANFPSVWYHSTRPDRVMGDDGVTYYGWNLPELDALLDAMDAALTPEEFRAARIAVNKYFNEEALHGWIWVSTRYGIASAKVKDFWFFPAPGGGPIEEHPELWYIGE